MGAYLLVIPSLVCIYFTWRERKEYTKYHELSALYTRQLDDLQKTAQEMEMLQGDLRRETERVRAIGQAMQKPTSPMAVEAAVDTVLQHLQGPPKIIH